MLILIGLFIPRVDSVIDGIVVILNRGLFRTRIVLSRNGTLCRVYTRVTLVTGLTALILPPVYTIVISVILLLSSDVRVMRLI